MPALGMAQETGKVLRWLKAEGDAVAAGEALLEVETDKVTVEIEAPAEGTLAGVTAPDGTEVPVGTVIAVVLGAGEELATVAVAAEAVPVQVAAVATAAVSSGNGAAAATVETAVRPRRRLASPKARRLAASRGIDLDVLAGSGPGGAVVAADVEAAATAPAPMPVAAPLDGSGLEVGTLWRVMAERTTRSWQEVPQFVLSRDVDASRLQTWRDAARRKPGCEKLTLTDLLVKLCAGALRRHPRVAASWRDGALVAGAGANVGIAVATEDGLVVPVVHGADALPLAGITARRREIAEAARSGTLRPEDVQGGVFTISNLGMFGVDAFQAIVNAPQAAILAVGRILERPVAANGEVVARPVLTLTVSFDHRVVDGARGAEFLDTLASLVEEPAGLVE
ncbi:MAG TPA: dihydrolipoamide acetyltransferase family protein [Gaiellaceae bacterium]|nr:dihydrolipoamide acetyltransferase family protein [Gaiellaceae bacterium]